jgi:hypothetical protein
VNNYKRIAALWDAYIESIEPGDHTEDDVRVMLGIAKVVRKHGPKNKPQGWTETGYTTESGLPSGVFYTAPVGTPPPVSFSKAPTVAVKKPSTVSPGWVSDNRCGEFPHVPNEGRQGPAPHVAHMYGPKPVPGLWCDGYVNPPNVVVKESDLANDGVQLQDRLRSDLAVVRRVAEGGSRRVNRDSPEG